MRLPLLLAAALAIPLNVQLSGDFSERCGAAAAADDPATPPSPPSSESATSSGSANADGAEAEAEAEPFTIDPLGPNGACYVCHMSFVREEFARVHLVKTITCVKCHGLSDKHANDENIGATKPDITFKRDQIDESCKKCHRAHNVPAKDVITRFLDRKLPRDRKMVCIDCHGMHKIEEAAVAE